MLLSFIVLYLLISIGVGLYAATRVHNTADYAVAGRSLPLAVVIATTFATWFGSETVLGVSARFVSETWGRWSRTPLVHPCAWCWWVSFLPTSSTRRT